ncbi:MAG: response regulator transcription factor, partial [Bacteroidota bacterium]
MYKILLIEDDESFGYILSEYLSLHAYEIHWAKNAVEGLAKATQQQFDLGIFDIMLPDQNGYEVATQIRRDCPELPFIFLSAKSLKIDKLKGYKVGADDYITKPVDEELLLAKIKVLIKRSAYQADNANSFSIGQYAFDASLQQLQLGADTIRLTQREAELLRLLCQKQNKLLSRRQALSEIWGSTDEFSRKSMDVFISHLRKYL